MHGRYVTDILNMCMKYFNAENNFDKFRNFNESFTTGYVNDGLRRGKTGFWSFRSG